MYSVFCSWCCLMCFVNNPPAEILETLIAGWTQRHKIRTCRCIFAFLWDFEPQKKKKKQCENNKLTFYCA